ALQASVTRFRLAANPPDLLITVPRGAARALDFHRASELIALGRARATEALDAVHRPARP
ncbi:MAG: esterase, partial [Spirochaetota bacterium]